MPYPNQVDSDQIIDAAWRLIEADGLAALSLSRLAAEFGIKAPSLYRHVGNKDNLLRAVNTRTARQLIGALDDSVRTHADADAVTQFTAVMDSYRDFAHRHPRNYVLAMTNNQDSSRPDEAELEVWVLPVQGLMAEIVGEPLSLTALRGALALVHGFVMLELHGQLRRGGDLDEAFACSVQAFVQGWQANIPAP